MKTLSDLKISAINNNRVLLRLDLNVPIENNLITSDARLIAVLPTIKYLLDKNLTVIILSHLGRPTAGKFEEKYSLKIVADRLAGLLCEKVNFVNNWIDGISEDVYKTSRVVLCENVRFLEGETSNDLGLAKKMAALADTFVMDAFACSHRAHSSTVGIMEYTKQNVAGLLVEAEVEALSKVTKNSEKPVVAIVGGSKVSTKLDVLEYLVDKVDYLILGGGIANTFLKASGYNIGTSLFESELVATAKQIMDKAKRVTCNILLPLDVVLAKQISDDIETYCIEPQYIEPNNQDMILDFGPKTVAKFSQILETAKTILWNGPLGVFEKTPFKAGTRALAEDIANSKAFSIAGGGDTISAIEMFGVGDKITYTSTAGGAFLEYIAGNKLPAITKL